MKTDWIAGLLGPWSAELTLGSIFLRLAISMAMDRATYVSAYLMGHGEETQFPVSPVSSLSAASASGRPQ